MSAQVGMVSKQVRTPAAFVFSVATVASCPQCPFHAGNHTLRPGAKQGCESGEPGLCAPDAVNAHV
eukprot:275184-Rhodomonas_salina.1